MLENQKTRMHCMSVRSAHQQLLRTCAFTSQEITATSAPARALYAAILKSDTSIKLLQEQKLATDSTSIWLDFHFKLFCSLYVSQLNLQYPALITVSSHDVILAGARASDVITRRRANPVATASWDILCKTLVRCVFVDTTWATKHLYVWPSTSSRWRTINNDVSDHKKVALNLCNS